MPCALLKFHSTPCGMRRIEGVTAAAIVGLVGLVLRAHHRVMDGDAPNSGAAAPVTRLGQTRSPLATTLCSPGASLLEVRNC
jgi:hypothetical protein